MLNLIIISNKLTTNVYSYFWIKWGGGGASNDTNKGDYTTETKKEKKEKKKKKLMDKYTIP